MQAIVSGIESISKSLARREVPSSRRLLNVQTAFAHRMSQAFLGNGAQAFIGYTDIDI